MDMVLEWIYIDIRHPKYFDNNIYVHTSSLILIRDRRQWKKKEFVYKKITEKKELKNFGIVQ